MRENRTFGYSGSGIKSASFSRIVTSGSQLEQALYAKKTSKDLPCLTSIIEALEIVQYFEPTVRAAAISLHARELGISQLHFYAIALYAGLGGVA